MATTNNPFKRAEPVKRYLKVLLYGPSGSGKTFAALSFPRAAVVDSEGGSLLYAGKPGVPQFSYMVAKTLPELQAAIDFIEADKRQTFETLIVDSISVYFDVLKEANRNKSNDDIGVREWGRINGKMKGIYAKLANLPVHVVVCARETDILERTGSDFRKIGVKPDADKTLRYMFDFVVQMQPDHSGVVEKSRGVNLGTNGKLARVDWSVFQPVSEQQAAGIEVAIESDEDAAERQADMDWDEATVREWMASHQERNSLTTGDLLKALRVSKFSEWKRGRKAADEAVSMYIDTALSAPPAQARTN